MRESAVSEKLLETRLRSLRKQEEVKRKNLLRGKVHALFPEFQRTYWRIVRESLENFETDVASKDWAAYVRQVERAHGSEVLADLNEALRG